MARNVSASKRGFGYRELDDGEGVLGIYVDGLLAVEYQNVGGHLQMTFGENLTGVQQGINEQSATKNYKVGTRRTIGNRVLYYAHAANVQYLFPAYGVCNKNDMSETGNVATTVAAGATSLTLTSVAAIAANAYEDGWLCPETGTYGYFPYYQIKSNTVAGAGSIVYTVELYEPLPHALSTSNETISIMKNEFEGVDSIRAYVVENQDWPAWETYISWVGVPLAVNSSDLTVTKDYYFWAQTWGPTVLMMSDLYGAGGLIERGMRFYRDGSVIIGSSTASMLTYDYAGHLLPNCYYSGSAKDEVLCMLEMRP